MCVALDGSSHELDFVSLKTKILAQNLPKSGWSQLQLLRATANGSIRVLLDTLRHSSKNVFVVHCTASSEVELYLL